jgi:hypothetical protein
MHRRDSTGSECDRTYEEDVFELNEVVDTLGVQLELEFVDDLLEAISPVGHLD